MRTYDDLRPHPQMLKLLLRGAVADVGDASPYLYVVRSLDDVVMMHLACEFTPSSERRLMMLSGAEALAFADAKRWADPLQPTARELRALTVHTMLRHDSGLWWQSWESWKARADMPSTVEREAELAAEAAAAVRGLRWMWAERWLSRA